MSNLVSLTYPDIGENLVEGISDFRIPSESLIKENCHNSRASDDIDMKLGPIAKLDERKKNTSKKLTSYQKIVTSLSFFQFMVNLEQSRSWIPDE